jgi:phosphoserine phosphatase RsbU/P
LSSINEKKLKSEIEDLKAQLESRTLELNHYKAEVRRTNESLETVISDLTHELKLLIQIQRKLHPTEIKTIPGIDFSSKFLPGSEQGGDYFDIFETEDKMRFGIVMAACSGYGVSALFLSILIKLSAQMEAQKGIEPHLALEAIAKDLVPEISLKDSASLFFGIFDRRTYEFKYSSCGQVFAWLQLQNSSKSLIWLEPSAPMLTRSFQTPLLSSVLQMNSRDRLILCTEGVFKGLDFSHPAKGAVTSLVERAVATAPKSGVHEIRNEILFQSQQQLDSKDSNGMPKRDQTVIVIEIKDGVIKLAKK